MRHVSCVLSDKGDTRKVNQDALIVRSATLGEKWITFACVCDGMGGLSAGEKASGIAVGVFSEWFKNELPGLFTVGDYPKMQIYESLSKCIDEADARVRQYGKEQSAQCGTTAAGILIFGQKFITVNVGDSRVYIIRDGELHRLTKDQTYVQMKIEEGWDKEELENGKMRSVLLQCIGSGDIPVPVYSAGTVKPDDIFIVCSDGFRHKISEDEIAVAFSPDRVQGRESVDRIMQRLLKMNRDRGEKDNISVISVVVRG